MKTVRALSVKQQLKKMKIPLQLSQLYQDLAAQLSEHSTRLQASYLLKNVSTYQRLDCLLTLSLSANMSSFRPTQQIFTFSVMDIPSLILIARLERSNGVGVHQTKGFISSRLQQLYSFFKTFNFSALVVHSKLILNSDTLYVIGMAKSFASYTLHVSTLSPSTGQVIISANILSNIVDPLAHFAVLTRPNTTQPQALWIEQETLRFVGLTPTLKEKGKQLKGTGYTRIRDIGLNDQGHAVVSRKEGSSFVLKFDEVNSAKSAWEFVDSVRFFIQVPETIFNDTCWNFLGIIRGKYRPSLHWSTG